jgi:hypothetical protein
VTTTTDTTTHQPEPWYHEAGSSKCPHGPQPAYGSPEYDAWDDATSERHTPSEQDVVICLDAPMGDMCVECSADHNEAVPWSACDARAHAKPQGWATEYGHLPVTVWVGTTECLERECEELFDDQGDPIPGKDRCSHISVELICGGCSTLTADGYYEPTVPWIGPHSAPAA